MTCALAYLRASEAWTLTQVHRIRNNTAIAKPETIAWNALMGVDEMAPSRQENIWLWYKLFAYDRARKRSFWGKVRPGARVEGPLPAPPSRLQSPGFRGWEGHPE